MTTAIDTPLGHLANLKGKARPAKPLDAGGTCPLMKRTVQFLPLRYGLVENLQPGRDIPMPHELQSRKMGVRLLRDGYLYIVDNASGYLHEYHIEQGSISKLLWKGAQVSADTRTNAIGEPDLVFPRHGALHVAYSEFQWTAYKCSQVIGKPPEREKYMQSVSFGQIDCENVGAHLLTEKQTRRWLAEVAETSAAKDLPEGADPEENTAYHWEHKPLFRKAWIEELTSQVNAAHKHDFLFLVVRDDIGVMLDLAVAQLKVADWIERWSNDEDTQRKYLTGAYIQSMYQVTQKRLDQLATKDKRYQALLDDTNEDQREKLLEYLRVKRDYRGPAIFGDEQSWREQAQHNPLAKATMDMRDALGPQLFDKHSPAITDLELATWYALSGEKVGERGINQLAHREPMDAFVLKQQKLLSHWRSQLKSIRADRLKMIIEGHFHRAAWYYDFRQNEQIQHRLEREFNCVAAICDDQQATEQLQAYLEKNPLVQVPGLDTLNLADQADLRKKLADLSDFSIKLADAPGVVRNMDVLANQFNSLMRQSLPNYDNLNTRFSGLNSLLGSAYDPARQLRVAARLAQAQLDFQRGASIDPNDFIRSIGPAARLRLLSAYASSGLQLRVASASEVELFTRDRNAALALRNDLKTLYKERREKLRGQTTDADPLGSRKRINQDINFFKYQLGPIEERLSLALTPGGGAGQFGLVLGNMDPQLKEEMRRTVDDYRSTGTYKAPMRGVLRSTGDQIAVVLFYLQVMKFFEVASKVRSNEDRGWKDLLDLGESLIATLSAGFAAVQGLSINILRAHIDQMESAAGKLNTMSKLGKWSAFAGLGAFGFGIGAAAFDLGKHTKQWMNALAEGDGKKLATTSLQLAGDSILAGANVWALKHTASITREIMRKPMELRALAWAERSVQLVGIATRANLIGIAATGLQLMGEALFNYFNLDAMNKWVLHGAWGQESLGLSLDEDWRKLASIVQQPVCQLIRTEYSTELRLTFPGIRSDEMERRKVWIEALQRQKDYSAPYGSQNPVYWAVCSEALAGQLKRVGPADGALVLSLDLRPLISDHFGLAIAVSYNLEEHRDISHRSTFHVLDLHRQQVEGRWRERKGVFAYKAEPDESMQLTATPPWLLREVDLEASNAE
ncbi:hypothetical protein CFII64_17351 [Pseudomonas sp. CFII64]|uniref:toxin VasX n=1 Tax=Pseudomonas sp. CFII64 TaxID=911242 RepID=UPI0003582070|nr:toxin VasX [Pseudomonas sp. CFII64]EPJ81988.1 hypothetical protein CFII64_17351 [Pseudomonas sp. CFII64]